MPDEWRMRAQIKCIAASEVAPISAIAHIVEVKLIESWKDRGKYILCFSEPAEEIGPIPLVRGGRIKALQNVRYTPRDALTASKTLDDLWQGTLDCITMPAP